MDKPIAAPELCSGTIRLFYLYLFIYLFIIYLLIYLFIYLLSYLSIYLFLFFIFYLFICANNLWNELKETLISSFCHSSLK